MESEKNGAVVSMVGGAEVITPYYTAANLSYRMAVDELLVLVRLGEAADDVVYINPAHVVAVQPATVAPTPTNEEEVTDGSEHHQ